MNIMALSSAKVLIRTYEPYCTYSCNTDLQHMHLDAFLCKCAMCAVVDVLSCCRQRQV